MIDYRRRDALQILNRLYTGRVSFLDAEYSRWIKKRNYTEKDRGWLVSLLRNIVKHQSFIDGVLKEYLPRWGKLPMAIQNLLRIGVAGASVPFFSLFCCSERSGGNYKRHRSEFTALVNAVLWKIARKRDYYSAILEEEGMELSPF